MRKMSRLGVRVGTAVSLLLFFLAAAAPAGTAPVQADAREIVKKMDELYRSKSGFVVMEMEIITPHWQRTLKMNAWSIGMDQTFIRILEPKKESGMATLRVGNEMWNFLPKTNKVIKIPPSMMMGSWMGSDFTNDDLVKEYTFLEDYTFDFAEVENPQAGVVYVKCVPKEGLPIVWGYIISAVRENDYIPLWAKYYDEKGKLMREVEYKDIKTFGKRTIPAVMELVPSHKEGNKTIVRYLEAQFDVGVDKEIFSLRNLRSRI
jgi:outer membrane lipoprotein-sorting protein